MSPTGIVSAWAAAVGASDMPGGRVSVAAPSSNLIACGARFVTSSLTSKNCFMKPPPTGSAIHMITGWSSIHTGVPCTSSAGLPVARSAGKVTHAQSLGPLPVPPPPFHQAPPEPLPK